MVDVSVCVEVLEKLKVGRIRDEESECVEVGGIEVCESVSVCLIHESMIYVDNVVVEMYICSSVSSMESSLVEEGVFAVEAFVGS